MTVVLSMAIDQFHRVQMAERRLARDKANLETDVSRLNKEELAEYMKVTEEMNARS